MRRPVFLTVFILVLICAAQAKELKRDPDTGTIRVLYIGAPFMTSPYQTFKMDPLLSTTPIQANQYALPLSWIKKAMRVYMPRTRESMVSKYDVIGIDDASWACYRFDLIRWMADACREDAMGMFMAGGYESFGGNVGFPSWGDTTLSEVMPVECLREYRGGANYVDDFEDEFIRSIPWDTYHNHRLFCGYNVLLTRQGAHELSHMVSSTPGVVGREDPCWVWWDIGNGRFFASAGGFRGVSGWCQFYNWKYYSDFVCNLQYFLAGLTPPTDLELMHNTRSAFKDVYNQRLILMSTLDFISKFNADTRKADLKIQEALESLNKARDHFVDLELAESRELAETSYDQFEEAYGLALEAKNAAIFWIFVTEWLVVSATSMICAFAIWTLMIRRRLYREVQVTRGGRRIVQ